MTQVSVPSNVRRSGKRSLFTSAAVLLVVLGLQTAVIAQSPWERAATNLEATFTGPLARSLALVAIVIGGLMFMFGEGGSIPTRSD